MQAKYGTLNFDLILFCRFKKKDWKPTEGIRYVTLAYGVLSVLFMLAAGYFFHEELKSSKKSPAESRNLNQPCFIMIFDNHDIWHFLSAGGKHKLHSYFTHCNYHQLLIKCQGSFTSSCSSSRSKTTTGISREIRSLCSNSM